MILEGHDHPALFCFGDAFFNAFDAPFEAIVLGAAGQNWLDAARLHEVIEILDCVPASRIQPNAGHAQFIGNLEALMGVLDLALPFGRILLYEILMDRQAYRRDAVAECMALQLLQIGAVGCRQRFLFGDVHLPVENVQSFDANLGGFFNYGFDRHLFGFEMPVRVSGDAQFDPFFRSGGG